MLLKKCNLLGVAISSKEEDIAVAAFRSGVKIFAKNGKFKLNLKEASGEVAATSDGKYVTNIYRHFICYDSQGRQLSKIETYDQDGKLSNALAVAADSKKRIIVGLYGFTISVHHTDGSWIGSFRTKCVPESVAVTSKGELVVRFNGNDIQLMDFSGGNVRDIQPPPDVHKWSPGHVCCNDKYGEIFVGNRGHPRAIYSYTSDGEYLGLVTEEVDNPQGIAVFKDGQRLVVAEWENKVKIFQRQ